MVAGQPLSGLVKRREYSDSEAHTGRISWRVIVFDTEQQETDIRE